MNTNMLTFAVILAAYAAFCGLKGWASLSEREFQLKLPHLMKTLHGVVGSHSLTREFKPARGYRGGAAGRTVPGEQGISRENHVFGACQFETAIHTHQGEYMEKKITSDKHNGCRFKYYAIAHRDADGRMIMPGCPRCAIKIGSRGSNDLERQTTMRILHMVREGRLIVHDLVSRKTLSGNAIETVVMNGDKVQICLHTDWWAGNGNLDPESLHTPTEGCPGCAAQANDAGNTPEQNEIVSMLRELWIEGGLAVYDPVSHWLMSGEMMAGICTNGDAVQITLAESWPYGGSYPAEDEGEEEEEMPSLP